MKLTKYLPYVKSGKETAFEHSKVNHIIQVQKQIISTALNSSIA